MNEEDEFRDDGMGALGALVMAFVGFASGSVTTFAFMRLWS